MNKTLEEKTIDKEKIDKLLKEIDLTLPTLPVDTNKDVILKEYEQIQKLLAIGSTAKLHTATIVTKPSVAHSAAFYQPKSVKEGEKLKSEASQCATVKKSA